MKELKKAAAIIAVLIGGIIFVALLMVTHFPIKSCEELQRMYRPELVRVDCSPR